MLFEDGLPVYSELAVSGETLSTVTKFSFRFGKKKDVASGIGPARRSTLPTLSSGGSSCVVRLRISGKRWRWWRINHRLGMNGPLIKNKRVQRAYDLNESRDSVVTGGRIQQCRCVTGGVRFVCCPPYNSTYLPPIISSRYGHFLCFIDGNKTILNIFFMHVYRT